MSDIEDQNNPPPGSIRVWDGKESKWVLPQPASASMQSILDDVAAFHRACDVPVVDTGPSEPTADRVLLRRSLIDEEHKELIGAMHRGDLVAIADGIVDLIYVLIGTALEYGFLAIPAVWAAVQRANMAKVDPAAGRVAKRSDGKVLKPPGWTAPDVEGALYGRVPDALSGVRPDEHVAAIGKLRAALAVALSLVGVSDNEWSDRDEADEKACSEILQETARLQWGSKLTRLLQTEGCAPIPEAGGDIDADTRAAFVAFLQDQGVKIRADLTAAEKL